MAAAVGMGGGTRPSSPSPKPNKHMASSHAPRKTWALHDRSSTLGSSATAATAKVPRAHRKYLHRDGPFEPMLVSIGGENWRTSGPWPIAADHVPAPTANPPLPRVPADPPCLLEHNGGIPVCCSRSGHLSHHQALAVTLCGTRDVRPFRLCATASLSIHPFGV